MIYAILAVVGAFVALLGVVNVQHSNNVDLKKDNVEVKRQRDEARAANAELASSISGVRETCNATKAVVEQQGIDTVQRKARTKAALAKIKPVDITTLLGVAQHSAGSTAVEQCANAHIILTDLARDENK